MRRGLCDSETATVATSFSANNSVVLFVCKQWYSVYDRARVCTEWSRKMANATKFGWWGNCCREMWVNAS